MDTILDTDLVDCGCFMVFGFFLIMGCLCYSVYALVQYLSTVI